MRDLQLAVHRCVTAPARMDDIDRDLRVLDPASRTGVLALHADRMVSYAPTGFTPA